MTVRVAGVGLAHLHVHSLLAKADDHPDADVVGVCDETPDRREVDAESVARAFDLPDERVYDDVDRCVTETDPDLVVVCSAPADHADAVERVAPHDVNVLVEKPFAPTLADADRMLAAMDGSDGRFGVNWPLAWYPAHRTTKRLIDEGAIGDVQTVHYHDGNRSSGRFADVTVEEDGSLTGTDGPVETDSWWFDPDAGGGSLVDYLGYGTTLATWFRDGDLPDAVTAAEHVPSDAAVDTHSATIAHYDTGLSTFRTSWETFTDPWDHQPQPKCGFVIRGSRGTVSSYDYEESVTLQTRDHPEGRTVPVDDLEPPRQNAIQYLVHCIEAGHPVEFGPLSPGLNRKSQRIVGAARRSAETGERVSLVE